MRDICCRIMKNFKVKMDRIFLDPLEGLRAQQNQITKIIASLSIEQGLRTVLYQNEGAPIDVRKIVKVLQSLLSDSMLYQNKTVKHKVLQSKNGWVELEYLLNLKEVESTLFQVDFFRRIDKELIAKFIRTEMQLHPCSLIVNKKKIRRKIPFVDKMSLVKPVYIEGYKEQENMKSIRQSLTSSTEIYKFNFKIGQCWGYVYAAEPQKILDLSQLPIKKIHIDNVNSELDEGMKRFLAVSYQKMIMQEESTADNGASRFFPPGLYKPFIKAYLDSEVPIIDAEAFQEVQNRFGPLDFSNDHKMFRLLIKAWDEQQYDSEREQMEIEDLDHISLSNQNIRNTLKEPNQNQQLFLSIKRLIDQKRKDLIQNFIRFYQPSLQFNSIAFADHPETRNIETKHLNQNLSLSPKDEQFIDAALERTLMNFNQVKTQIFN